MQDEVYRNRAKLQSMAGAEGRKEERKGVERKRVSRKEGRKNGR
jgi:hypothetical protein